MGNSSWTPCYLQCTMYTVIERLINSFNVLHITYVDDLILYISLSGDANSAFLSLTNCVNTVSHWFMLNGLLVNSTASLRQ